MRPIVSALVAISLALPARAEDAPAPKAEAPASSGQISTAPKSGQAAVSAGVRIATGGTGSWAADLFLGILTLGLYTAIAHEAVAEQHDMVQEDHWAHVLERRADDGDHPPPAWQQRRFRDAYRRHRDAREGFLFSFGLGGGAMRFSGATTSPSGARKTRAGALDLGLRIGYGFSDRFQLFGDFTADVGFYPYSEQITNWIVTLRGQTVLVGDTAGNGLNLNLGFGLGGITRGNTAYAVDYTSPAAPAFVAGLSYDARVGHYFSLSPELYFSYHDVPNPAPFANDHLWSAGLRLNFLWYSPVY